MGFTDIFTDKEIADDLKFYMTQINEVSGTGVGTWSMSTLCVCCKPAHLLETQLCIKC